MTVTDFEEMLKLLTEVTKDNKLTWRSEDRNNISYGASVSGCKIVISLFYDSMSMSNKASLEMFNTSGQSFKKYTYGKAVNPEKYAQIKDLFDVVKDHYFRITESESMILNGLRKLTDENAS